MAVTPQGSPWESEGALGAAYSQNSVCVCVGGMGTVLEACRAQGVEMRVAWFVKNFTGWLDPLSGWQGSGRVGQKMMTRSLKLWFGTVGLRVIEIPVWGGTFAMMKVSRLRSAVSHPFSCNLKLPPPPSPQLMERVAFPCGLRKELQDSGGECQISNRIRKGKVGSRAETQLRF